MYCRKCLKESEGEKKVNMEVNLEGQFYHCPECGEVVYWKTEQEN
jgi:predicted RNA-binding Zn-ribbon protein involved in translation (DUF1610 family)